MEVVIFIAMMIVPVISVVALAVAVMNNRRIKGLKSLTARLLRTVDKGESESKQAYNDYMLGEL